MRYTILSLNWTGQALSAEQQLVVRNVAAKHLRDGRKNPVINFAHDLCAGHITRGEVGTWGTFSGTFFKADLGTVGGEPWTMDFMIPRGTEHLQTDDDSVIISTRPLPTGKQEIRQVDHKAAAVKDAPTLH